MDTSTLTKYIGSHDFVWVPIVAFSVVLLIAALIGFWNGWKTSLYFFGWNVVGLIVGVLTSGVILSAIQNIKLFESILDAVKDLAGPIIILVFMVATNFIAFLIYFIFRKKLKKSIKTNKKAGISNAPSRFIGMGIAIASSAPIAVFAASTTGMMSEENGFTKFIDKMTKGFTGGKYEGSGDIRTATLSISHLADVFGNLGDDEDIKNIDTAKVNKSLQDLVNSDAIKSVDSIYNAAKKNDKFKDALDSVDTTTVDDIDKVPDGIKVEASPAQKEKLRGMLENIFDGNSNKDDLVKKLLDKIVKTA